MASIGHIAVGMAAARVARPGPQPAGSLIASMLGWSALSLLPDADVIGFRYGIAYGDPWGHRGATHSFVFAIATGILLGLIAFAVGRSALRTAMIATLVVGSHAILDTMTDGGLGCALWWPFDDARVFAPWNPIPVAPIGWRFFSSAGLSVALTEALLFGPLYLYALWPRRKLHLSEGAAPRQGAADELGQANDTEN